MKIVNTSETSQKLEIEIKGVVDQDAKTHILHSDDPEVNNKLRFIGEPQYSVKIKHSFRTVSDEAIDLEINKFSVYVITIKKTNQSVTCVIN